MTSILQSLKGIAQCSSDIEYLPLGFRGKFEIKSQEDLDYLLDQYNLDDIKLDFDFKKMPLDEDFKIGSDYFYKLTVKIPETKSNFFSNAKYLLEYILNTTQLVQWDEKIVLPFSAEFHPESYNYKDYFIYLNRLICLYKEHTYWDSRKSFVLFTDKPLLVPLLVHSVDFKVYKNYFDSIEYSVFSNAIENLETYLNGETIAAHKKEKQSIFIMESSKILESYDESLRFYKLIESIGKINSSTEISFTSYLNNFSFQKLELELKKDLDYFVKSINDSLGSLQTQALGLPVAAALIQLNKVNLSVSYVALMVFSGFVFFNAFQQDKQVEYIVASIDRFFKNDNVKPVVEKDNTLQKMNSILDERIKYIIIYIKLIASVAIFTFIYSLYNFLESIEFNYISFLFQYILIWVCIYGISLVIKRKLLHNI